MEWTTKLAAHYSKSLIFVPKSQFWQNLTFRDIWIFCAKIGRYSWIFHLSKYQKIEFSYQNSRFWPKIELTKTLEKVNFGAKIRNSSIFENFNFKIFCQNCVQKVKFTTMQLFPKVEFCTKNGGLEQCVFSHFSHTVF